MGIEKEVDKANQRLKKSRMGVTVLQRGSKLSLRATLPPKPGTGRVESSQQTISLDIYANQAGVQRAEAEARKVGGLLACKEFSWEPYLGGEARTVRTVAEWTAKFKEDYFDRRAANPESLTTWRTDYQTVFNVLLPEEELSAELLRRWEAPDGSEGTTSCDECRGCGQLASS